MRSLIVAIAGYVLVPVGLVMLLAGVLLLGLADGSSIDGSHVSMAVALAVLGGGALVLLGGLAFMVWADRLRRVNQTLR